MKASHLFSLGLLALLMSDEIVSASTINTSLISGTQWGVDSVTELDTTGNMMDGMTITAIFSDNTTSTSIWKDNSGAGNAFGNGSWSLGISNSTSGYDGSTFSSRTIWSLSNSTDSYITSLEIDGYSGNTVFDTIYNSSSEFTPSSANGWSIHSEDTNSHLIVNAQYSNIVAIKGDTNSPYNDLFQTLTLNFTHDDSYRGFGNEILKFTADTDNVVANPVPEPATMILFGLGLLGIAGARRTRNKIICPSLD